MERVARGFDTEPIQRGLARIPPRIRDRVGPVDFLCGVDPVYAGLHAGEQPDVEHGYTPGIDWAACAHLVYPHRVFSPARSDRIPTVVLPDNAEAAWGREWTEGAIVAHELGHWLDHQTGFGEWIGGGAIMPVSRYAETNWWEAFAESFEAWLYPEFYPDAAGILRDSPVLSLFEELAR